MIGLNYRLDFVRLAGEEKPITGVEDGSTLYEVDTQVLYIFYKGTWYEQSDDMNSTSNNEEQSNNETREHTKNDVVIEQLDNESREPTKDDVIIEPSIFEPIIKGDENEKNK